MTQTHQRTDDSSEEYDPIPFCYRVMLEAGIKNRDACSLYVLLIKCCDNKPWCVRPTTDLLILSHRPLHVFKKSLRILVDSGLVIVRPIQNAPKNDDWNEYIVPILGKAFFASADTTLTDEDQSRSDWVVVADTFAAARPQRWKFAIDTIDVEILEIRDIPLYVRFHGLDGRPGIAEEQARAYAKAEAESKAKAKKRRSSVVSRKRLR